MTDELHAMDMRLMLSVWSKIDRNCEVGRDMASKGYYIEGTDWIDFFNPDAAALYWKNFSEKLLPTGIDAWWLDATEPENDDLRGRMVAGGTIPGEFYRNAYPNMVNHTVFNGLRESQPDREPIILTRSGFTGIQRYGAINWSGDVGNDWETLRRQIAGGLNLMATGQPGGLTMQAAFSVPMTSTQMPTIRSVCCAGCRHPYSCPSCVCTAI